jgi:multiple antibiotic resistance protein
MWWQRHLGEFVTLLLVVNPFAVLPVFLAITTKLEPAARRKLALHAVGISFAVLVFFVFAGKFLLEHLGISIRAFQIAGGIVLFVFALEMLRGETYESAQSGEQGHLALAVYPLAIPKIAGPATMVAIILLTDDDRHNIQGQLATIGILAIVLVIQLALLLAAGPISRLIGSAGAAVIGRIMGMLIAAFAVSMVLTAVGDWLDLPKI